MYIYISLSHTFQNMNFTHKHEISQTLKFQDKCDQKIYHIIKDILNIIYLY